MGIFSSKIDTIGDAKWAKIKKGAEKTQQRNGGMFSKKATDQRKASNKQLRNANNN